MKSEFQAKFLQHLVSRKKSDQGFTLIELLVVVIIIGILAAIALPSFLNQAAKAKQSEAKNYVGSVNRAQQAYRIEKPQFATDVKSLEIGIPTTTVDYEYKVATSGKSSTTFTALPTDSTTLRSYAGGVMILANGQTSAATCQSKGPSGADVSPDLTDTTNGAECKAANEVMR